VAQLKNQYRQKSYLVQDIQPAQIHEVQKEGEHGMTLFDEKRVFFVRNLGPYLSKSRSFTPTVRALSESDAVEVVDWEEGKSAYELGVKDKKVLTEFKPAASIFAFLDNCVPGNKKQYTSLLHRVLETQEEMFVYVMLSKHIRSVLMAYYKTFPDRIAPWQKGKLASQAQKWKEERLIRFYDGLIKIDIDLKTSARPFSIKQSLEMLGLYYL
jgi:hypothetical protein